MAHPDPEQNDLTLQTVFDTDGETIAPEAVALVEPKALDNTSTNGNSNVYHNEDGSAEIVHEVNAVPKTVKKTESKASAKVKGLTFERRYTKAGVDPFDEIVWEYRTASITGDKGETVFEQKDIETPAFWSQLATNVVVSKYFRGQIGSPQRETSVKQLIGRVVGRIVEWGNEGGYFASTSDADIFRDELKYILVNQFASFNSPVWFNLGWEGRRQASSACYINQVDDSMESILDLYKTEGMLFKDGSGSGLNLSTLRSSKEKLAAGGYSSGPVSFMKGLDASAGSIKSGGSTRRAACMRVLNVEHPDIIEFIDCKADAEKKAHDLIEMGHSGAFNVKGGAYDTVPYQNANHSVRVTDAFMQAVENDDVWQTRAVTTGEVTDTYQAREIMKHIADAAWVCGDPGMQYHDTTNRWHVCLNSDEIHASNPCSEFVFLNNTACNLASLNLMKFRTVDGEFDVESFKHSVRIVITAQEMLVGFSHYPTPKITQMSHNYRPLGLGYANLGALLMARGLPYDSDAGRAYAAAITSIMTGEAYRQSAIVSRDCGGPFAGYEHNREPALRVMRQHREHVEYVDSKLAPEGLLKAARESWDDVVKLSEKHGIRNAQVSVLAPTGCLVDGSMVITDRGVMRLRRLGNVNGKDWQDVNFKVLTDEGEQTATKFYVNGIELTRKIGTKCGYTIQGTLKHRIKVVNRETGKLEWKRFADIMPGDMTALSMGQLVGEPRTVNLPPLGEEYWTGDYTTRVPRTMTPELAELIGYFMGDGSMHSKGPRFCVSNTDFDVAERVNELVKSLFNLKAIITEQQGYYEVAVHSVPLTLWWEACGFTKLMPSSDHSGKGYQPYIPDAVLASNDPVIYGSFLRGLFEADGTVTGGIPCWSTVSREFAEEVKTLMLALGIPTTTRETIPGWGAVPVQVVRLRNSSYASRFLQKIGFMGARKSATVTTNSSEQTARYDYIYVDPEVINELVPAGSEFSNAIALSRKRHGGAITRRAVEAVYAKTGDLRLAHALSFFYDEVASNEDGGERLTYDLSVPSNVTYIANGFISHNTIGFMMDCDTTGVEPDIALVKYKTLVGGGLMKIVNQTVPEALLRLGYSDGQISDIIAYIDETGTIEEAPHLKDEHLPVFDCAFRPYNGKRSIAPMGHVKMMSAVQPFISGAISKTVNMPNDATSEDIADIYLQAWNLGLKAIAIYRDGCKKTQPLSTKNPTDDKTTDQTEAAKNETIAAQAAAPTDTPAAQIITQIVEVARPTRRRLNDERTSVTHKFSVGGHEGYITVGLFEDGKPGEIFITMSKEGSVISGLMDAFATSISLALQYGVPLETLVDKFSHMRFEPSGFTGNQNIPFAKSIMDYIFRWLGSKFLSNGVPEPSLSLEERANIKSTPQPEAQAVASSIDLNDVAEREKQVFATQSDAPPCPDCGMILIRNGACYKCLNCGLSYGCS